MRVEGVWIAQSDHHVRRQDLHREGFRTSALRFFCRCAGLLSRQFCQCVVGWLGRAVGSQYAIASFLVIHWKPCAQIPDRDPL